jgi:hypothetical protein
MRKPLAHWVVLRKKKEKKIILVDNPGEGAV